MGIGMGTACDVLVFALFLAASTAKDSTSSLIATVEPAATSANLESQFFGISDFEGDDDEEISQFWARALAFHYIDERYLHLAAVKENRGK